MRILLFFFFLITLLNDFYTSAQNNLSTKKTLANFEYSSDNSALVNIDNPKNKEWLTYYRNKQKYLTTHISLNTFDAVKVKLIFNKKFNFKELTFKIEETATELSKKNINDTTLLLVLPENKDDYTVSVFSNEIKVNQIEIHHFSKIEHKIIIVPIVNRKIDVDSFQKELKSIYSQVNLNFNVEVKSVFRINNKIDTNLFSNPNINNENYTHEMRNLRDLYFEKYPNSNTNAYYLFVIPGFNDLKINSYMPRNKAIGFISKNSANFYYQLSKTMAYGLGTLQDSWLNKGPQKGSTFNLMDTTMGKELTFFQWDLIRSNCNSYLYYDAEEDVKSINGRVAYYSWSEDENGLIKIQGGNLINTIKRPFKKNYLSYHLNIKDVLLKPLFTIGKYFICWFHFIFFSILIIISIYFRRKWKSRTHFLYTYPKIVTKLLFLGLLLLNTTIYIGSFILIQNQILKHRITSGYLEDLHNYSFQQAIEEIVYHEKIKREDETNLKSELLLKRDNKWYMRTKGNVLYFALHKDTNDRWNKCHFAYDSKILDIPTKNFKEKVESHYMVFNYYNEKDEVINQRVFNHNGTEITKKLSINEDPAKRILLFINGYRSSSIGRTFEETFSDIKKNGLEFPNSSNLIYLFDRYDYWRPWKEIDLKFQKRINPTETYYADGHFSVNTSNYGSLIDFTTTTTIYPKRCSNKNKHTCKKIKKNDSFFSWFKSDKTIDLLPSESNKDGFELRKENGRIAGKNLLQMLNEIPNKALNDTIIIVAHSMGYAYGLGIVEELNGKINLGEFYIIAPENAESGYINLKNWKTVYQFGCDASRYKNNAPCMLDGIAPQKKTNGIPKENHVFIPEKYYSRHGFYDSHFIGYYTWIFDIPENKPGHIRQR